MQKALVCVEIGRRNSGHQVFHLVRMQGRVDHAEGAAHADAHEVDFIHTLLLANVIDHGTYIPVDMVIDR